MGEFTVLVLMHYLNRHRKVNNMLSVEKVNEINQYIKEWDSLATSNKKCHMGRQFCYVFNIKFRDIHCNDINDLAGKYKKFLKWLRNFIKDNNINFPNVEIFFVILVFNSIDGSRLAENSKYNLSIDLAKTQDLIDQALLQASPIDDWQESSMSSITPSDKHSLFTEEDSEQKIIKFNYELKQQMDYLPLINHYN